MTDQLTPENAELFRNRFYQHLEAGDDAMNARCRIVEEGCPVELADQLEEEAEEDEL